MPAVQFWHHWMHSSTGFCVNLHDRGGRVVPFQFGTFIMQTRYRNVWTHPPLRFEQWSEHFGFFFTTSSRHSSNTRSSSVRHGKQLADIRDRGFLEIERRSALRLIWVYNRIPEDIIRHDNVKDFQRSLQSFFKRSYVIRI